jgi:hypothetical protein
VGNQQDKTHGEADKTAVLCRCAAAYLSSEFTLQPALE